MRDSLFKRVVNEWPLFLLIGFVAVLQYGLLLKIPGTGDHFVHLYKGWLMADQLLPSGRLTGWSHMTFAGDPVGMYYPIGADLLLSLVHFVTFGALSWDLVYRLNLFFVVMAVPVCAYVLVRPAAGPIAALFAGILAAGDVGGWRQGGSVFTLYWGVWPCVFAAVLALVSLLLLEPALSRPLKEKPGAAIGLALLLAMTVLTHPMAALFDIIAVPLFIVVLAVGRRKRLSPWKILGRSAVVGGLSALLAIFWLMPQIFGGMEQTASFGSKWVSFTSLWAKLAQNQLFDEFSWVAFVLGIVGFGFGLASRRLWPTYLALLLLCSLTFASLLGAVDAEKIQPERLVIFIKGVWFALAGYGTHRLGQILLALGTLSTKTRPRLCRVVAFTQLHSVLSLVAFAVLVYFTWGVSYARVRKTSFVDQELRDGLIEADNWLGKQPLAPLDRVLYQPGRLCSAKDTRNKLCKRAYNRHFLSDAPLRTGRPRLKLGFEPAAVFGAMPLENHWAGDVGIIAAIQRDPEALRNLHIRWIVSFAQWPTRPDLRLVHHNQSVWVYAVTTTPPEPTRLIGAGAVKSTAFEDERIAVEVSGAAPSSLLLLPVSNHPYWKAINNGTALPITAADISLGLGRKVLISVPAKNGTTVFTFCRPSREKLAGWLSFTAWLACASVLLAYGVRALLKARAVRAPAPFADREGAPSCAFPED